LIACIAVDDLSWAKIGERLGCDPKTAKVWTLDAIRALAAV
jgi:hypothetical protein